MYALIFQQDIKSPYPLLILKLIVKTINTKIKMMAHLIIRVRSRFSLLIRPGISHNIRPSDFIIFELAITQSEELQIAFENYPGRISIYFS